MTQTSTDETSFWQKLTDQQTTTTVGLGYVTTNPSDPSTSYWPGPGYLPSFKLGREWITHYTSAKYVSSTTDSTTSRHSIDLADFDHSLGHNHQREDQDSFVSDILITYKLKNPTQFLRDVFDARDLKEFASRFPAGTSLYMVTGYKVSRNVSTALEQQESQDTGLTFQLSTKLYGPTPVKIGGPHADINAKVTQNDLTKITYQAPGDSIFFVRYQRVQLDQTYPNVLCLPPKRLSWKEWLGGGMWTRQTRTIVLPRLNDTSQQRLLVTTDSVAVAVRKMLEMRQLPDTGRRTTFASSDEQLLVTTLVNSDQSLDESSSCRRGDLVQLP